MFNISVIKKGVKLKLVFIKVLRNVKRVLEPRFTLEYNRDRKK